MASRTCPKFSLKVALLGGTTEWRSSHMRYTLLEPDILRWLYFRLKSKMEKHGRGRTRREYRLHKWACGNGEITIGRRRILQDISTPVQGKTSWRNTDGTDDGR